MQKEILRQDKFKAIWMSHSSLNDFLQCERLYYLKNIYKNKNKKKIAIASPHAVLGIAIHNVLENLVNFNSAERVKKNILEEFILEWEKIKWMTGWKEEVEEEKIKLNEFKERGEEIMRAVMNDFNILKNKTIAEKDYYTGELLPNFYLSEKENIILCGNIDWIEYDENKKELVVVDFKTGKNEEKEDSNQLPIYKILLEALQKKWKVSEMGKYWYLDKNEIKEKILDQNTLENIKKEILETGIIIRDKRFEWTHDIGWMTVRDVEENFPKTCKNKWCDCAKYEKIINGEGEYLGADIYGKDLYKI